MVVLDNMGLAPARADALGKARCVRRVGAFYYDTPAVERIVTVINKKIYGWNGTTGGD